MRFFQVEFNNGQGSYWFYGHTFCTMQTQMAHHIQDPRSFPRSAALFSRRCLPCPPPYTQLRQLVIPKLSDGVTLACSPAPAAWTLFLLRQPLALQLLSSRITPSSSLLALDGSDKTIGCYMRARSLAIYVYGHHDILGPLSLETLRGKCFNCLLHHVAFCHCRTCFFSVLGASVPHNVLLQYSQITMGRHLDRS